MNKCILFILLLFSSSLIANAAGKQDTAAIYQGTSIKLDIAMPVLELARSAGKIQSYELATSIRLAKRFYPTLELGYAIAERSADGGLYEGNGGYGRIGTDVAVIKKGEKENNLLIGVRFGGAYQKYDLTNVTVHTGYWPSSSHNFYGQSRFDCWGEVVAGPQVMVYKGFQMGWYIRMKFLFTRSAKDGGPLPYYIPGIGFRKDFNWGVSYYLAYKF